MGRGSMVSGWPMPSCDDDGTQADIEPVRQEKRNYKSGTGNMAKDGYAVIARRPRALDPGTILDNDEAARVDALYSDPETYED